mgnify:CR=1 FL=1
MDRTKLITSLVILCLASAVAAFLMPPAHGALLSFVSIASAAVIAVCAGHFFSARRCHAGADADAASRVLT